MKIKKFIPCILFVISTVLLPGPSVFAATLIEDDFSSGDVPRGNVMLTMAGAGRQQSTQSQWTISDGALSNSATGAAGDRGVGWLIDLASVGEDMTRINLSFDHVSGNAEEKLFVHLYGFVRLEASTEGRMLVNIYATNGNAWTLGVDSDNPATDPFRIDNFVTGRPQGALHPNRGDSAGAFEVDLSGSSGSVARSFDLSRISGDDAPTDLADYDYLAVAITRDALGNDPSIRIDNLVVTADKPSKGTVILISSFGGWSLLFGCGALAFSRFVLRLQARHSNPE